MKNTISMEVYLYSNHIISLFDMQTYYTIVVNLIQIKI